MNYTYQFEIGQSSWSSSEVGVFTQTTLNSGINSINWKSSNWYANGSGTNKQVQTIFNDDGGSNETFHLTTVDTYYITGRASGNSNASYTYTDQNGWNGNESLTTTDCHYLTVSALPDPASFNSSNTNHNSTDLSWTKQAHSSGSGDYEVLVLRKIEN